MLAFNKHSIRFVTFFHSITYTNAFLFLYPVDWYSKLSMLFWFWTLMILPALLLQELFYLFWQVMKLLMKVPFGVGKVPVPSKSSWHVNSTLEIGCGVSGWVQDNNLLSSETCVHFLLKLLNPPVNVVDAKAPSIGSKLLGIGKFQMLNGSNKDVDSCSEDILSKVEENLLSCKEIKPADRDYKRTTRPELCSKWLALLTMEKACLSVVALE
ncbi:hypothetical protein ACJX0J_019654, partial [Zea mays]